MDVGVFESLWRTLPQHDSAPPATADTSQPVDVSAILHVMRTSVNLSSRPFTNHRILWIAVIAVFFIGLWLLLWSAAEQSRVSAKADEVQMRIDSQKAAAIKAREERERKEQEQQEIVIGDVEALQLASARYLIGQKGFSWNQLLSDLERLVPKQARITGIKIEGLADTGGSLTARVQLKALGATAAQMTEMMSNASNSGGLFAVVQGDQDAVADSGETPFTLELTYRPARGDGQ